MVGTIEEVYRGIQGKDVRFRTEGLDFYRFSRKRKAGFRLAGAYFHEVVRHMHVGFFTESDVEGVLRSLRGRVRCC